MERTVRPCVQFHLLRAWHADMGTAIREVVSCRGDNARGSDRVVRDARLKRYGVVYQKQSGRSECFIVSVRRRGRTYTRRFASSKHGSLAAALEAAIRWRDACLAATPVFTLREFHARVRSNNTSGVHSPRLTQESGKQTKAKGGSHGHLAQGMLALQ